MQRFRVIARGRVQGVGYRYATRAEADRLGVAGWVRNRPDGSVEAEIEGAPDAVAALRAWMRRGPAGARVDDLETADVPATGADGFRVLPTA